MTSPDLEFAVQIAKEAGPLALRDFRRELAVEDKNAGADTEFDPVTAADRAIERLLRERIGERFPDDGILGEEEAAHEGTNARRWVLDPIDGTRSFVTGAVGWGTLVGLLDADRPLVSVLHQPYLGETFYGSPEGSWFERAPVGLESQRIKRRIATRTNEHLDQAVLYCTHPSMFAIGPERDAFDDLCGELRMSRFGGDCYSYGLLAMGAIDLVVENQLHPHDILPLIALVEGAGGLVTDLDGGAPLEGGYVVSASNSAIHEQALNRLRR